MVKATSRFITPVEGHYPKKGSSRVLVELAYLDGVQPAKLAEGRHNYLLDQ
jgi:hypothetical protein